MREGCPHCAAAEKFLEQLGRERPELSIVGARNDQRADSRDGLYRDRFSGYTPDFASAAWPVRRPTSSPTRAWAGAVKSR